MRCFVERSFVAQQTINIKELRAGASITIWNKCGLRGWLLGALAKLRKRLLVMSVCLSARMEQLGCHWTDFHEIWFWSIFRKSVEKIKFN